LDVKSPGKPNYLFTPYYTQNTPPMLQKISQFKKYFKKTDGAGKPGNELKPPEAAVKKRPAANGGRSS